MSIASDDLRLFGLDLRTLWRDVRSPWRKLALAPALSWLEPRVAIGVHEVNGEVHQRSIWRPDAKSHGFVRVEGSALPVAESKVKTVADAVLLPEALLLRKRLVMPLLDGHQLDQALALEALNSTPFASGDLVWGYGLSPVAGEESGDVRVVDLVLASRGRVEQFLETRRDSGVPDSSAIEVWSLQSGRADAALLMNGFGEAKRQRGIQQYWILLGVLSAIVVALCIALVLTPYLQLRARVQQANTAYLILDKEAAPALAKREELVRVQEQAATLGKIIGNRLDPLQVVQMLTEKLGDDIMLHRLQMDGRKILIVGQANDSAGLMQKLGSQPQVKEVRAPSAAVRQPGAIKETFQIEFQLADDFGVSEADAKVAAALAPASDASAPQAPASAASAPAASASAASAPQAPASAAAPTASAPATAASQAKAPATPASGPGARGAFGAPAAGAARSAFGAPSGPPGGTNANAAKPQAPNGGAK